MTESVPPAMASQLELAEGFGLIVEEIVPDSPAAAAGVQRYDVLKLLNDQELTEPNQLAALVRNYGKDREVSLTILRKGQEQKLTLKVGERMMPERRASFTPSPGEFAPRLDAARERGEEFGRRMQENMRAEPPKFETPGAPNAPDGQPRRAEPPRPLDLLRESRPGGAPQVRVDQDGAVTTWNTGHARVVVKDEKGEIELRSEDGHRTVVAKDPAGETIFTGPVDTEEQRQALPEPVRKKLAEIQVQTEAKAAAERSTGESSRRAQPPREVQ